MSSFTKRLSVFVADNNMIDIFQQRNIAIVTLVALMIISLSYSWEDLQKWWKKRAKLMKLAKELPGPVALPLLGNALLLVKRNQGFLETLTDITRSYKTPSRFWLGPTLYVILTHPRDLEVILRSSNAYEKADMYRLAGAVFGNGLITASETVHKTHRRAIKPMFPKHVLNFYVEYFDVHSRRCVELLEKKVDTGEFDVLPFMVNCSTDIVLETLLGATGEAQKGGYQEFIHLNEKMYDYMFYRMIRLWYHPDWLFSLTSVATRQRYAINFIRNVFAEILSRRRRERSFDEKSVKSRESAALVLLDQILEFNEKTNLMNDEELKDEMHTLFLASQDTTSIIAAFVLLMLGMHPEVQDKVREEAAEVLGDGEVYAERLPDLKYLEFVVKETLRLFPIAPALLRKLSGDVQLESCLLPEGCTILMALYVTFRDPEIWENPETFNPERFSPENSKNRHPCAFIPFSSGLRGCIGQAYAMTCLKTMTVNIVRKFEIKARGSLKDVKIDMDISVRSLSGHKISLTRLRKS